MTMRMLDFGHYYFPCFRERIFSSQRVEHSDAMQDPIRRLGVKFREISLRLSIFLGITISFFSVNLLSMIQGRACLLGNMIIVMLTCAEEGCVDGETGESDLDRRGLVSVSHWQTGLIRLQFGHHLRFWHLRHNIQQCISSRYSIITCLYY